LEVLYGGLGTSKSQFWIQKDRKKIQLMFLVIKTLDPDSLEMLDLDPNPDPQHCQKHTVLLASVFLV
jgi:hypothetical protein